MVAVVGALLLASAQGALASDSRASSPYLNIGRPTSAPMAYLVFCVRNPTHCRTGSTDIANMTNELMAMLQSVNRSVNRSIRPRNDRGDIWQVNVRVGDCEDYALTKRARLIQAGLPPGALRMATARTASGEGHAVLVVHTSAGDYVLDNRTNTVRLWSQTGLRWVAMSSANPRHWNRF